MTINEAIEQNIKDGIPISKQTLLLPAMVQFETTIETPYGELKVCGCKHVNVSALVHTAFFDLDWIDQIRDHLLKALGAEIRRLG